MPPKKGPSKKTVQNAQAKIVEDKTFGLKNKNKSKKVQQYVKQVQQQAKQKFRDPKTTRKEEDDMAKAKLLKAAKEEKEKEISSLFRAVADVKQVNLQKGEDPKSVLCAYFKAGTCVRGDKCKYSHDIGLARKSAKINLYQDPREADTMDKWDQSKLEQVVAEKNTSRPNQTEIICKYFLDAIESQKYGWFWQCPNGENCIYRHALPPGFVLKNKEEKKDDSDAVPIEELIGYERAALDSSTVTPVTPESFAAWKERRKKKREEEIEKLKKDPDKKGGKVAGLSGRSLFIYDPSLFVDDDEAAGQDSYELMGSIEEEKQERHAPDQADDDANDAVANVNDASLFLEDDVELPDDDEAEEDDQNS